MAVKRKDLAAIGWGSDKESCGLAYRYAAEAKRAGWRQKEILTRLAALRGNPAQYLDDELFGGLAQHLAAIIEEHGALPIAPVLNDRPVPCSVWGRDGIDANTFEQMDRACRLPIAVAGAQMPDGHVGYGLPIGGVLATRGAVIPYGVGVDIGCRMKLSIIDLPAARLDGLKDMLKKTLMAQTAFGVGVAFPAGARRQHDVMDSPLWKRVPPIIAGLRDRAWSQLGSSGSGNHFVEWGEFDLPIADLGLPAGRHLALLSHSGSRGFGAYVADYYTKIAMDSCPLPREARHLAWLDLSTSAGAEYWEAMELAGAYAAANHDCIHRHVLAAAGLKALVQVENHHNFAWKEYHLGEELIVHRKGATPAGEGVLGVIPGSMGDPGFVVRGKGHPKSLNSAAHGAGRKLSRKAAKQSVTRNQMMRYLKERRVELISAGLDESPMAYKNINEVMAAQKDLVETIGAFYPRIVLMADDGKSED